MLVARRIKWGMAGKVSGRIYRECLALLHPRLSFRHVLASHRIQLDLLACTDEECMRLAPRLGKGREVDRLSEKYYINDDVGLLSFESSCGSRRFEKNWSWKDPDLSRLAL